MKKVFAFLILCMALALARIMLLVLAVALLLALLHAFVTRPRDTLAFLGTLILSSLAVAQPIALIGSVVAVALAALLTRRLKRSERRRLAPNR